MEADALAKSKVSPLFTSPSTYTLPGNAWGCYVQKQCIMTQLPMILKKHINSQATLSYWEKRKQTSQEQLQEIDWMSLGRVMQSVPLSKHRWASKQMSGHFAHSKNMVRWKQRTLAQCPRCGAMVEDKAHIVKCTDEQASAKWNEAISNLTKWMKETNTAPHLISTMVNGLQAWRQDNNATDESSAALQQKRIGWDTVLDGWIGMEW